MTETYEFNGMKIDLIEAQGNIEPTQRAYVFHGFPGLTTQNQDLAAQLAAKRNMSCHLPVFRGIGRSQGRFLFSQSVDDSLTLLKQSETPAILVGHSFGGFVSLQLAAKAPEKVSSLVLLAPLSHLPERSWAEAAIDDFLEIHQVIRESASSREDLIEDFLSFAKTYSVEEITQKIQVPVFLVHGSGDETIPVEYSRSLAELLENCSYFETDDDHRLSNRKRLHELILNWPALKSSLEDA